MRVLADALSLIRTGGLQMRVFAANSSPRPDDESKTALMLSHLVRGMREAGAEVEVVNLREKKINVCTGCFFCWTKTPGECVHDDDMTLEIYPKWLESDIAIYATPLYDLNMSAYMKIFVERLIPMVEPYIKAREGRFYHPRRNRYPAVVLLSVCGYPDISQFECLSESFRRLFGIAFRDEILRSGSEALLYSGKLAEILEATERAGKELVTRKHITQKTLDIVTQPLDSAEVTAHLGNLLWKTCVEKGVTPQEFWDRRMIPYPDSIEAYLSIMRYGFNPEGAAEADAVLQFDFSGEQEGSCQIKVLKGTIETAMGTPYEPTLIIETPFEVWIEIISGEIDPQQAFMEQKCRAEGDFELLLKLQDWFANYKRRSGR